MKLVRLAVMLLCMVSLPGLAFAQSGPNSLKAELDGYHEVPSLSTTGSGELRLKILDEVAIEFELTYRDLEGATTTASHVHLGRTATNGGVSFFLCGGGGRPPCTADSGTFTGIVTASDIIGPSGQGIAAGEIAEVVRALRAGAMYVNVHTNLYPGGEIRGQIRGD